AACEEPTLLLGMNNQQVLPFERPQLLDGSTLVFNLLAFSDPRRPLPMVCALFSQPQLHAAWLPEATRVRLAYNPGMFGPTLRVKLSRAPVLARTKRDEAEAKKKSARTFSMSPFDEDEYDIPTFLRRQAD
ncbi:MAG: hypothetical protein Q8R92_09420, partial [Deltaproteobacteria bacterium]|nr:hypothetical protein [Deltaproteobacteria bacterium]